MTTPTHDPCPRCGAEVEGFQVLPDGESASEFLATHSATPRDLYLIPCGHSVQGWTMDKRGRCYDWVTDG